MKLGLALLLIFSFAVVTAAGKEANSGDVEQGFLFVTKNCSRCHAIGREGESPHPSAPPFRILHERYPVEMLEEAMAEGIYAGHPDMPQFVLSPAQIANVIAYLRSLEPHPAVLGTWVH